MHAVLNNLIKNLVNYWRGGVIIQDDAPWLISPQDWVQIGVEIEAARSHIPASFGRSMEAHRGWMTAEDWMVFIQHVGPAVLEGRLAQPYFDHFLATT